MSCLEIGAPNVPVLFISTLTARPRTRSRKRLLALETTQPLFVPPAMVRPAVIMVSDEAIGEIVARSGGYEKIEKYGQWLRIANSLGLRKDQAQAVKARYEDMLRASAEADEREDEEDEEFEVEDILDSRTDDKGNIEYLVKWKDAAGDDAGEEADELNMTWEPRAHLACPELLQQFEEKQRRMQFGSSVAANGDGDDDGEEGATAAPGPGASSADGAAAIEDEDGAGAAASKRKHDERDGPGGGLASPPTGAEGPPASSASDTWERIVRLRRPEGARAPLVFEVLTAAGGHVLLPNEKLRNEAPLLLVDFYEQRLQFE